MKIDVNLFLNYSCIDGKCSFRVSKVYVIYMNFLFFKLPLCFMYFQSLFKDVISRFCINHTFSEDARHITWLFYRWCLLYKYEMRERTGRTYRHIILILTFNICLVRFQYFCFPWLSMDEMHSCLICTFSRHI